MATPLINLFKRIIETFGDQLYIRDFTFRGDTYKNGARNDADYQFGLSIDANCHIYRLTENIKGEFKTYYTVLLPNRNGEQKEKKSTESEIEYLKTKNPNDFDNESHAFFYFIMKTYFDTFLLINEEMMDTKTALVVTDVIKMLKKKDIRIGRLSSFDDLKERIEDFYEPGGEGMLKAKEHYSEIIGPEETKD